MVRFEAPRLVGVVPRAGRTIERVESHGKHLEIEWDDGIILHTHMRMSGSWHVYRKDDSWQRPHREMRALIEVADWSAVCFNAPVVETYRAPDVHRHPGLGGLGPDLCRPDADLRRCIDALLAVRRPAGDRGRGVARSAGVLWGRQRLPLRGPLGLRDEPVRPGERARRGRRRSARPRRRQAVAGQPPERRAGHRARPARGPRRVRPHRAALPALRGEHRDAPVGQPRPGALLVSGVPAAPRLPSLERSGRHADGPPSGRGQVPRGTSLAAAARPAEQRTHIWAGSVATGGTDPAQIIGWDDSRPDGGYSVEIASRTFMLEALYDG